jgi:protein tyrosine/serine phosphatase
MTRHLSFEGIENFRDFGGYATAGGRALKAGRLFRSGHHARASDADLETLAGLGIAVIVDLRRPEERARDPSRRWPGFAGTVIASEAQQEKMVEWLTFLAASDLSIAAFRRYMLDYYRAAPTEPRYLDLYSRYFRALADSDGPVLVHCAAGKDRTGVLCALTHHMAGVHDDDITVDYLLTNDPERIEARLGVVGPLIREATGRTPSDEAIRYAISVDAEFLAEAFAAMREDFGSLDGYLDRALGLTPARREAICQRLLG